MAATRDIVQKLWNLCHVLRDDGVTYLQYVTELTFLLFLKMAQETNQEKELPKEYRWAELVKRDNTEQLPFYRELLLHLGSRGSTRVQLIFANATTVHRRSPEVQRERRRTSGRAPPRSWRAWRICPISSSTRRRWSSTSTRATIYSRTGRTQGRSPSG